MLGLEGAYTLLGTIYMQKGILDSAKINLMNALALDSIVQNPDMMADIYQQLSKVYEKEGNPEESIKYLKKYSSYKDSVFSPSNLNELSEAIKSFERKI